MALFHEPHEPLLPALCPLPLLIHLPQQKLHLAARTRQMLARFASISLNLALGVPIDSRSGTVSFMRERCGPPVKRCERNWSGARSVQKPHAEPGPPPPENVGGVPVKASMLAGVNAPAASVPVMSVVRRACVG